MIYLSIQKKLSLNTTQLTYLITLIYNIDYFQIYKKTNVTIIHNFVIN